MWLWSYLPMTFCCLTSVKTWWVGISLFSIFLNTTKVHSFFFYSQLPILLHCLCSKEIFTAATLSCCSNSPFTKRHTNQQFAVKSFWVIVIEVTHTYRYYHYISNFSLKKKKNQTNPYSKCTFSHAWTVPENGWASMEWCLVCCPQGCKKHEQSKL